MARRSAPPIDLADGISVAKKIMSESTFRILLVDSSRIFHSIFDEAFADGAFSAKTCESGSAALVELGRETYHVVCSAMYLPDMDGAQLCAAIRKMPQYALVPFLLFTAEAPTSVIQGVTEVFRKQDILELLNFIRRFPFKNRPLHGRVLVVEDTASQREYIAGLFRSYGLDVEAHACAEDALDALRTADFDLVVSDVVLGGSLSGLSFVNRIRRLDAPKGDTPVLAVTAFDDATRRIELFGQGINDYVTKPVIEVELIARVRNLISLRRLIQQIKDQKRKAERDSAEKTRFLATMSRELRGPLNSIIGFSQLLAIDAGRSLGAEQLRQVSEIRAAGENLLNLVNEALDLSLIEAALVQLSPEPVALPEAIAQGIAAVKERADAGGVKLLYEPSRPSQATPTLNADPVRLRQLIASVLRHAVERSDENSTLSISTREGGNNSCRIEFAAALGRMSEELFDGGAGSDDLDRGIDVAFSRRLIELMQGALGAETKPDGTRVFWIELPRGEVTASMPQLGEPADRNIGGRRRGSARGTHVVLYIEDSPAGLSLIEKALHRLPAVRFLGTRSAQQGLDLAQQERPDLILTDINLSGMSGYQLLSALRQQESTRRIPVVAISARAMREDIERGHQAGFSRYLTKPINIAELLNVVSDLLDGLQN
jgi:CheY-like chemotaxis protein